MIEMDVTPVPVRGDELDEIWWQGRQWAVTAYGIEKRDGTYAIEADRLWERGFDGGADVGEPFDDPLPFG